MRRQFASIALMLSLPAMSFAQDVDTSGDTASSQNPPARVAVSMIESFCIDCHRSEQFRIVSGAVEKLAEQKVDSAILDGLGKLMGRWFPTQIASFAALAATPEEPLSSEQRELVLKQTQN